MAGAFRSMTVIVSNETDTELFFLDKGAKHGIWVDAFPVAPFIPGGSAMRPGEGAWRTESDGFLTGTDAWAKYRMEDGATHFIMGWDSPAKGDPGAGYYLEGPKAEQYEVINICSAEGNATCRYILREKAAALPTTDASE